MSTEITQDIGGFRGVLESVACIAENIGTFERNEKA